MIGGRCIVLLRYSGAVLIGDDGVCRRDKVELVKLILAKAACLVEELGSGYLGLLQAVFLGRNSLINAAQNGGSLSLRLGNNGGGASACVALYLNAQLLSRQNGTIESILIVAVLLDFLDKYLHFALESGILLLQSLKSIGDIVEIILDCAHVVAAEHGLRVIKALFTDILMSDHI